MNYKFKRQLIIITLSKFKIQNLNQELKKKKKSPSIRPTVAITENYNNVRIGNPVGSVPGSSSYPSTKKYGK